jgi:hypothetical protein
VRRRASSWLGVFLALALAVAAAGCGGDDDTSATGTSATPTSTGAATTDAGGPACAAVSDINRLDDEIETKVRAALSSLTRGVPDPAQLDELVGALKSAIADIESDAPKLYAAYDRIKEQAPDAVDKDVDAVKDVTAELLAALKRIDKPDDFATFNEALANNPKIRDGVQATLRLDTWVRDTCGVGITN